MGQEAAFGSSGRDVSLSAHGAAPDRLSHSLRRQQDAAIRHISRVLPHMEGANRTNEGTGEVASPGALHSRTASEFLCAALHRSVSPGTWGCS